MMIYVQNAFTLEIEETKEIFFINKVYLKSAKKSLVQQGSVISGFCFNQDQGLKASSTNPERNVFFLVPYPLLPRAQNKNKRLGWDNAVTGNYSTCIL